MSLILAVDTGNTRTKLGLFGADGTLLDVTAIETERVIAGAKALLAQHEGDLSIGWISTSRVWTEKDWADLGKDRNLTVYSINTQTDWPFGHAYQTPETLGADRFAAIVAGCNHSPGKPVLVVDAGTAITYEAANLDPQYLGGAISPGMQMRYDALHHFTARLPQLYAEGNPPLIGDSTLNSLKAGVETAVAREIDGMIEAYREQLGEDLVVYLTGGDAGYFENQLKNVNFADAFLVLRGIYFIIKHIAST